MSTSEHRSEVLELVKSILTSSQTRTTEHGSRLKRLHGAARIICAQFAPKFHTCTMQCVLSEVHAPGQNGFSFYPGAAKLYEVFTGCGTSEHRSEVLFFIRLPFSALRRGSSIAGWCGSHSPDAPYSRLRTGSYRRGDRSQGRETSRRPRQRKHGSRWN